MWFAYSLGLAAWGVAALALARPKRVRMTHAVWRTVVYFLGLVPFHAFMIGRIYYYGSGTTQVLLWHVMYLDDVLFFALFPLFVGTFVEAFACRTSR